MNLRDRIVGAIPWLLAGLIVAGIVHIVSILMLPRLASEDAYARLARNAPLHKLTILPDTMVASGLLPFEDPATVLAVCRFDLRTGPLRLRGKVSGDGVLLMSFRNRYGISFYAMNDRGANRGELDVVVVTKEQLEEIEASDPEDEIPAELRLESPSLNGFALIRALAVEPGQRSQAIESLKRIECGAGRDKDSGAKAPAQGGP